MCECIGQKKEERKKEECLCLWCDSNPVWDLLWMPPVDKHVDVWTKTKTYINTRSDRQTEIKKKKKKRHKRQKQEGEKDGEERRNRVKQSSNFKASFYPICLEF